MALEKLSPRKPDLLDELNDLRKRRGITYRGGDLIALEVIHQEMKAFWLRNGWNETEAQDEYLIHCSECQTPYNEKIEEPTTIKGRLLQLVNS